MRHPPYNVKAPKQTVSLTLNSDLYSKAKKLGINSSRVAEEALNFAVTKRLTEELKAEILQDLAAYNAYVEEHGSPTKLLALPRRMMPLVRVKSENCVLLIPSLTNLPAIDLRKAVDNIGSRREEIVAALDYLFLGADVQAAG